MKKIYTRTGDDGTTSLFGGDRVGKGNARIDAYGTVDETNSVVGLARAHLNGDPGAERLDPVLQEIQDELFVVGADLATPMDAKPVVPRVTDDHVKEVENRIDAFDEELKPLKNFILPSGTVAATQLHLARTVCRRAERILVKASATTTFNETAAHYLNRLSDLLFVLARWANKQSGVREDTWSPTSATDAGGEAT
ncbi:ATP:cob(I)alamin adenosyltransferase [Longibacter salinarum]|uniref:Corrinoid adenosyltransferase n=1 Tax=Longibacter salinarum TaxID=1850348 RepID=A0A2A8D2N5_9BACT|nr:cob(I)yrinic acid a,c-diamide adenosyltransferase [Longibacter salinarum]PEN14918.1 ATP:cob(I)alamin adenosyltransferase [Longibacter salinarum]